MFAVETLKLFAKKDTLKIKVSGDCMEPQLSDGSIVTVRASRWCFPGDVIAFLTSNQQLLLHRVIGYRPTISGFKILTQADSAFHPDAPVSFAKMIGRTIDVPVPFSLRLFAVRRFSHHVWRRLRKKIS
jgi:phage repressor protein C with HTH and peptisase S24 domain